MKYANKIADGMTAREIFTEINTRQIIALMFHREMSVYYAFMGLRGFKRWHEYQYKEETDENISMYHYYIEHNDDLIPKQDVAPVSLIPSDWYTVARMNVGTVTKRNAVSKGMAEYQEWESETKDIFQKYQQMLFNMGRTKDACIVGKLVCGVDNELKRLEKIMEELKLTDNDPVYLAEIQKHIHDKYKKLMGKA